MRYAKCSLNAKMYPEKRDAALLGAVARFLTAFQRLVVEGL